VVAGSEWSEKVCRLQPSDKVSKHCTDGAGYPEKAECGDPMDTASSHKDVTERHRGTIIIKGGGEFPAMIN
jgi:hypothetical protein